MIAPTATEVRGWSKLNFAELGFADDPSLGRLVAVATATLLKITGLKLADVPEEQKPLVEMAVQGLTEQLAYQAQESNLETLSDFDLIKSFSVGPYSETRRDAEDAAKARKLNAWPWLSDLLWGLLTPDQYDYWIAFFGGDAPPAFSVTEMDWSAYEGLDYPPDGVPAPWGG